MSFPTDDTILKSVYLSAQEATKNGKCLLDTGAQYLTSSIEFLKTELMPNRKTKTLVGMVSTKNLESLIGDVSAFRSQIAG